MFGIFKKTTKREKLLKLYNKKKEEAFKLSKIDRRKSDEKEKDILTDLDNLDSKKDN